MNISASNAGSGHPVVFLHGFCETRFIWQQFAHSFSSDQLVIIPDLPGFGASSLSDSELTISGVAKSIYHYLKETFNISKCFWVGHSLGGYIILEVLRQYPEAVSGFCLMNSTCFEDSREKKENRNKLIDFVDKHGVAPFVKTLVPSLFSLENQSRFKGEIENIRSNALKVSTETVKQYAAAMRDRRDSSALLASYKDRAILIAGREDMNISIDVNKKMGALIHQENFHLLDNTAHMAMFEQRITVQHILGDFFKVLC